MRVNGPGDVLLYDGELARVIDISDGRAIILEFVADTAPCPTCHQVRRVHVLEESRLFQNRARPVETLVVS